MRKDKFTLLISEHNRFLRTGGKLGVKMDIKDINFERCRLEGESIGGIKIINSNMSYLTFNRCDMKRVILKGSNISHVHFNECDLSGADFTNTVACDTNFYRCDFFGAKGIRVFGPMPTSGRMITSIWHDRKEYTGWMVSAGCFWGNLDDLEAEVEANHGCSFYLSIIKLLRENPYQK